MLNLLFISNNPESIRAAIAAGVNRIFVDLEINGKVERQGHLNTHITSHKLCDVKVARDVIDKVDCGNAKLLVRINPFNSEIKSEIDSVIKDGADIIMLPMIQSVDAVSEVSRIIDGRVRFIPLIETYYSFEKLDEITSIDSVEEVFFGLNDLHLDYSLRFMFEPLSNGMLEMASNILNAKNVTFGFGGVARVGEGLLPAELILGEHLRLGSSSVILSRSFMASCPQDESFSDFFKNEINKIRNCVIKLSERNLCVINHDHNITCDIINRISEGAK